MSDENTRKSEDLSEEQLKQIAGGTVNTNRDVTMNPQKGADKSSDSEDQLLRQ
jgi:hypothetical protein